MSSLLALMRPSETEDTMTLLIGPATSPKKFVVHKSFACYYSPVLKEAFNGEFMGGQTQTYKLEDTTAGAFALFVQWLYTQKIVLETQDDVTAQWQSLIYLWVLAEKFLIHRLQNQTIDSIDQCQRTSKTINVSNLKYIYENTSAASPLRRLFLYFCTWSMAAETFTDPAFNRQFPEAMLHDLCFRFRGMVETRITRNMTEFHVKEDENSS